MCPLNRHHWKRVNRLALQIHSAASRDDMVVLAIEDLPPAIGIGHAHWSETSDSLSIETVHTSRHFTATCHQLANRLFLRGDHEATLAIHHEHLINDEQGAMFTAVCGHFQIACRRLLPRESVTAVPLLEPADTLTRREREVLPHLLNGRTTPDIAITLGISPRTVEKHVAAILEKNGISNRHSLMQIRFQAPKNELSTKNG